MARRICALGAFLSLALAAIPASASLLEALDLAQLVARADHVVLATPIRRQTRWDAYQRIVTDVTLRVETPLKGSSRPDAVLELRTLGGAIGELGMRVEGEPVFREGHRYLVFAVYRGGELRPVGMSQGVLPIERDQAGRDKVLPGGGGIALVRPLPDGTLAPAPPAILHPRPLEDVRAEIEAAVRRSGSTR